MANEYKKPTAWDVTTSVTSPGNAYDTTTAGDTTTAATRSVTGNVTANVTATHILQTWASPGQTYTALTLNMRANYTTSDLTAFEALEIEDGSVDVYYSTDNGSNWTLWESWSTSVNGTTSGAHNLTPINVYGIALSALRVRFILTAYKGTKVQICKFDDFCMYDGTPFPSGGYAQIDIYDVWTDGTYTAGTISGFSVNTAVPPVAVPYGTNVGLTCTFSGAALSVTPGSFGTWTSGTLQYAGETFTDTTWYATCGAATANCSVHISTPSVSAVTFSKNPATVGDLVTCYATVTGATGSYASPSFYIYSGPAMYDGAWVGAAWMSLSAGTYVIRATIGGPVAYTTYGSGSLTFYAAATGSLTGSSLTSVNQTYTVTPTFANGTGKLGSTQGAGDLYASVTSGSAYNRQAPASPGTQTTWLRVTNPAGDYIDTSFTTTSYAQPTCSLGASNNNPLYGASVNLTPTFANDSNSLVPLGTTAGGTQVSAGVVTGSNTAVTPLVPTTYYARAQNAAGQTADASVLVTPQTVSVAVPTPTASSSPVGTGVAFSASVSGAVNTAVTWSHSGVTGSWAGNVFTPTSAGTATITATSVADGTKSNSTTLTVTALAKGGKKSACASSC